MTQESVFDYNAYVMQRMKNVTDKLTFAGINTFSYKKFCDKSSKYLLVSNNAEWNQFHINNVEGNGEYNRALSQVRDDSLKIFLWPSCPKDKILKALYDHNIWNGVSFYKRKKGYVEGWGFGGDVSHEGLQNFLINNVGLIRDFITFFNSSFSDVREQNDPRLLANFKQKNDFSEAESDAEKQLSIIGKENNLIPKKTLYEAGDQKVWLTRRERQCIEELQKGLSLKEIARSISVANSTSMSPRTVESHLSNIRMKVNADSKMNMLDFFIRAAK